MHVQIEYLSWGFMQAHEGRHYQGNGWMDFSELWAIYSQHNEGTNTLVMMVCWAWAQEQAPLNSHWLVLKNGCTDFHDGWFVDSM